MSLGPYTVLELVGTIAFAVSGGAVAIRAGMDWLGIVVLADITAVGGGTVRDLLLGRSPVGWLADPWPLWVATLTAALVIADAYRQPRRALDARRLMLVADAAGLAVFTVTGVALGVAAGVDRPIAVILGVITGVGGGVIRDVLARQQPLVLVGQVYALTAVAGATTYVLLEQTQVDATVTRWLAVAVGLGLRLLAIRYDWSLPRPPHRSPDGAGTSST